jgi:hypothetical protein
LPVVRSTHECGRFLLRHREQAERVVGAEILLRQEREPREILETPEVVGVYPAASNAWW